MTSTAPASKTGLPFIDRPPTTDEVERLRLLLSTYQDGTGQQSRPNGRTLPNWRDFERSVAAAFRGQAQESKAIFDVLIPDAERKEVYYGFSCKMRRALNDVARTRRVTLELSNSSGKFWSELSKVGLNQSNYKMMPDRVGRVILEVYESWHRAVSIKAGGQVDIDKSFYLALMWNEAERFQLFQFSLHLPDPNSLQWEFPSTRRGDELGKRLVGRDVSGVLVEWYGESGAQLKYYPRVETAIWKSDLFQLEPLPSTTEGCGILAKAAAYFPEKWQQVY